MEAWLAPAIGVAGILVGGALGAIGTVWVQRIAKSRDARSESYRAWLKFGYRIPYTVMDAVRRGAGIDDAVRENLRAEVSELIAMVQLDASASMRKLVREKWDGVYESFGEAMKTSEERDALERMVKAHEASMLPFLMEVARQMSKDLHGRWRGR